MHPSWKECLECQGERSQLMDYGEPPRMPTLMEPSTASSPRGATVIEVPPGHPSHPAHDRIILNPHSAFYSDEGLMDMRIKGSENCRRALLGQALRNVVN